MKQRTKGFRTGFCFVFTFSEPASDERGGNGRQPLALAGDGDTQAMADTIEWQAITGSMRRQLRLPPSLNDAVVTAVVQGPQISLKSLTESSSFVTFGN